ncbi:tetratricopeptide repeat protein [Aerococcaceae bacterium WGS1372]
MSFKDERDMYEKFMEFLSKREKKDDLISDAFDEFFSLYSIDEDGEQIFVSMMMKLMRSNDNLEEISPEMKSFSILDQATEMEQGPERDALLHKAIEIYPENWYAHRALMDGNSLELIEQLRDLEKLARESWKTTSQGGWVNPDEHTYLTVKADLARELMTQGLLVEARDHFEELYHLDKTDFMGTRYVLMAIYCRTYDWERASKLFREFADPNDMDDQMLVPLLVLAILSGKNAYAKDLFHDLLQVNTAVGDILEADGFPIEKIMMVDETDGYEPGGFESLAIPLQEILPVIIDSDYLFEWMSREYQVESDHQKINLSEKVISFEGASQMYKQTETKEKYTKAEEEVDVLEGVVYNAAQILSDMGLVTAKAFEDYTEKEVLAIKFVGPKTIQQLKKNGVVFKDDN